MSAEHLASSERQRRCEMCGAPVAVPLVYCSACVAYIRDCEAEASA